MLLFFIYVYNFRNPISNVHSTIGKKKIVQNLYWQSLKFLKQFLLGHFFQFLEWRSELA